MPKYSPGSTRYPVYQISNPVDIGTLYYIKVVVQRASDLTTVATLKLISEGNGLYGGVNYQIPQDPTGQGYELFETTSVYTDSGYTSLSPNYQIVNTPIDVGVQITSSLIGGTGGGGYDFTDYKTIRKIITEELILLLEKIPQPQKFSTANLEQMLQELSDDLNDIRGFLTGELKSHRQDTEQGFKNIDKSILGVNDSVSKIPLNQIVEILGSHITEVQKNLLDLHKKHDELSEKYNSLDKNHKDYLEEMGSHFTNSLKGSSQEVRDMLTDYFSSVDTMIVNKGIPRPERHEPEKEKPDYLKIATGFIRQKKSK